MIRSARWFRNAAPAIGIGIAAGIALLASRTSEWLYGFLPFAFIPYLTLTVSKPRLPWNHDYRAPLLVLRSFTDLRAKVGSELPTDFGLGAGRLSYTWHLGDT